LILNKYDIDVNKYIYSKIYNADYECISETHFKTTNDWYIPKVWIDYYEYSYFEISKEEEVEYNKNLSIAEKKVFKKYWLDILDISSKNLVNEDNLNDTGLVIEYTFEITNANYEKIKKKCLWIFLLVIWQTKYLPAKFLSKLIISLEKIKVDYWKIEISLSRFNNFWISDTVLYSWLLLLVIRNEIQIISIIHDTISIRIIPNIKIKEIGNNLDIFISKEVQWFKCICYTNWEFEIWEYKSTIKRQESHYKNGVILFFTILKEWINKWILSYKWTYGNNRHIITGRKISTIEDETFKDIPNRFNLFCKNNNINLEIENDMSGIIINKKIRRKSV